MVKRWIQDALNPGVREVLGWAMYDFANSGYMLVVLTAVFAPFFTGVIVGNDKPWGASVWSWALAVSYLMVMLTATTLGQWADRHGAKRKLLMFTTAGCVVCTALLGMSGPGTVALAVGMVILSNTFYFWGEGFIAAFLPELARREKLGTISGLGWGIGYLGGMLTLGVCLASIIGLVLFGLLNWLFGARVGVGLIALLFVIGIVMVVPLNVQRGMALAEKAQ